MMNKIFTFLLGGAFVMTAVTANAQTPRVGLVEEATQASCPPCATANPGLQTLMNSNTDKALFLAYQVWWPGFDQMYLDNPDDVDTRVGEYYDFGFAPQVKLNGEFPAGGDGSVSTLTQATLDEAAMEMSEFDIVIDAEVVNGALTLTGSITGLADATGDLVLHLALTEGTIYSTQATGGTNGETEYHHVFKKFLPGTAGMDIADTWAAGDVMEINESYPLGGLTIYNWDDLEVIAFIQNNENKFVHHAVKDSDISLVAEFDNSAAGAELGGISPSFCLGAVTESPVFTLVNQGNSELTSATITYSVNGGTEQTMDWTGSLSLLASEDVTLDPITFDALAVNTFTAAVSMPNGVAEEGSTDDDVVTTEVAAVAAVGTIDVDIVVDNYGSETTWEIRDESGTAVLTGGPYADQTNGTLHSASYEIPAGGDGCYEFFIADSYGDGICCAYGEGSYTVSAGGTVVVQGGEFADDDARSFSGTSLVGIEEATFAAFVSVGPNPAKDILNVMVTANTSDVYTVDLINALGQKVLSTMLTDGAQAAINVASLETGIYQLMISNGQGTSIQKVSITR